MKKPIATLLLICSILLLFWASHHIQPKLIVENHSGQTIVAVRITIAGETLLIENLADGKTANSPFRIAADDHFVVDGRLADGTTLAGEFGYVTSGTLGDRARFTVGQGGRIDLKQWYGF
jgi:hypothetical protein